MEESQYDRVAHRQSTSPFVVGWVRRLACARHDKGRALDVATGSGGHALLMAAAGFRVTAIDWQFDRLVEARRAARTAQLHVALVCADLERLPLPSATFGLIVCTRYLDRALFPALRAALVPGGVLLYETFTENQLRHPRGPRSPKHLLHPGELRMLTGGMDLLFDEEVVEPEAMARVAAMRPMSDVPER